MVARGRGTRAAHLPRVVMRRASQVYPGEGETDGRDCFVIADTVRIHQARVFLAQIKKLLNELRVLGGYDDDVAHDRTGLRTGPATC